MLLPAEITAAHVSSTGNRRTGAHMSKPFIKRLKISNFKSIDTLELHDVGPFSVFAGANGTGKSNFFDALMFLNRLIVSGVEDSVRAHGGLETIRRAGSSAHETVFAFEIEAELLFPDAFPFQYKINIFEVNGDYEISEFMDMDGHTILSRERGKAPLLQWEGNAQRIEQFRGDYSALTMAIRSPVSEFLRNTRHYRIDPTLANRPSQSGSDVTVLDQRGSNLASVLSRIEEDTDIRETILEWMNLIVPSITSIETEHQVIDQRAAISFGESNTNQLFPAHLMSDGTIYALSLLVAVLGRPFGFGLTLIEEPERGLHPKAISELIGLMRENASSNHPIWVCTHSESVVKSTNLSELWLVDRKDARTIMTHASRLNLTDEDIRPLGMDDAWLSNLLGAGLPW